MFVYDPAFLSHVASEWHVERPERLTAVVEALQRAGLWRGVARPHPEDRHGLLLAHTGAYLDVLETGSVTVLDPETAVRPDTFAVARLAVGAAVEAARRAASGRRPWFALVRPPGHHAGPDYGGGFCYLNNIAIAAARLLESGVRRVAILDYDVHHGNGTADIFRSDPRVLYVSTHQWGIYPGTGPAEDVGDGGARGFTVNVPFRAGCGDASYIAAFDEVVAPICSVFRPEVVLVSLGVDAHYRDPIAGLTLSSPGYVELFRRTVAGAKAWSGGRIAVVLEGGYHLAALGEVMAGAAGVVAGTEVPLVLSEISDRECRGRDLIDHVRRVHGEFWNLR